MFRFQELLNQNVKRIARALSEEHGKTLPDAEAEVARGIEVVEFACGAPQLLKGEFSDSVGTGVDSYSLRQPLGVVAGITPFNFPAMVPMWMFPLALVCGNAFVLKPSERDPSVSILLAELLKDAGLPDGVFNVVQGDKVAVDALLQSSAGRRGEFRRLDARRALHPCGRHRARQARAGIGRRKESHGDHAGCGSARRDRALWLGAAYGSAGERCMAISVAVAVGDATADA